MGSKSSKAEKERKKVERASILLTQLAEQDRIETERRNRLIEQECVKKLQLIKVSLGEQEHLNKLERGRKQEFQYSPRAYQLNRENKIELEEQEQAIKHPELYNKENRASLKGNGSSVYKGNKTSDFRLVPEPKSICETVDCLIPVKDCLDEMGSKSSKAEKERQKVERARILLTQLAEQDRIETERRNRLIEQEHLNKLERGRKQEFRYSPRAYQLNRENKIELEEQEQAIKHPELYNKENRASLKGNGSSVYKGNKTSDFRLVPEPKSICETVDCLIPVKDCLDEMGSKSSKAEKERQEVERRRILLRAYQLNKENKIELEEQEQAIKHPELYNKENRASLKGNGSSVYKGNKTSGFRLVPEPKSICETVENKPAILETHGYSGKYPVNINEKASSEIVSRNKREAPTPKSKHRKTKNNLNTKSIKTAHASVVGRKPYNQLAADCTVPCSSLSNVKPKLCKNQFSSPPVVLPPNPSIDSMREEAINDILGWNVSWLDEYSQKEQKRMPPILKDSAILCEHWKRKDHYIDYNMYLDRFHPLWLMELWTMIHRDFTVEPQFQVTFDCKLLQSEQKQFKNYVRINITRETQYKYILDLCKDSLILVTSKEGSQKCFAMIEKPLFSIDQDDPPEPNEIMKECYTIYLRSDTILDGRLKIQLVSKLRGSLRLLHALDMFKLSPLQSIILTPKPEGHSLNQVFSAIVSETRLNPSQRQVVQTVAHDIIHNSEVPKIALVHGPPGTGKSQTILALVLEIFLLNRCNLRGANHGAIVVCGPSNGAVDAIGKKIIAAKEHSTGLADLNIVRVGSDQIADDMKEYSLHKLAKELKTSKITMKKAKRQVIEKAHVILSTLNSCGSDSFEEMGKPVCVVVDEACQANELEILVPLQFVDTNKLVLVGDHHQLAPTVLSNVAGSRHYDVSLFDRCRNMLVKQKSEHVMMFLDTQYRMVKSIASFPSAHVYASKLMTPKATCDGLSQTPDSFKLHEYRILDTCRDGGTEKKDESKSTSNQREALLVAQVCNQVMALSETKPEDIGIITFYRAQVGLIKKNFQEADAECTKEARVVMDVCRSVILDSKLNADIGDVQFFRIQKRLIEEFLKQPHYIQQKEPVKVLALCNSVILKSRLDPEVINLEFFKTQKLLIQQFLQLPHMNLSDIEVKTVDGFQGREKPVTVLSCVRAHTPSIGFLSDTRRMNVAITRAKYGLFIIGHCNSLNTDADWKALITDAYNRRCVIRIGGSDPISTSKAIDRLHVSAKVC